MYGTPCASSSRLSNSRWLSAQQLGCLRSIPPPLHAAGAASGGTGGFGAQLRHRVAGRSGTNGAGQKRPHRGPRCKPLRGAAGNVAVTAVKYCSSSHAEPITEAGEIRGHYPGLPNLADMFFTFREHKHIQKIR